MKVSTLLPFMAIAFFLSFTSCSTEDLSDNDVIMELGNPPQAKEIEIEILELINKYRIEKGLNSLGNNGTVKAVAFTHTDYMIEVNQVSHENFYQRRQVIEANENALVVAENVAYGFTSAQSVFNAWLNSPGHRGTIEGNFTDTDISAEQDEDGNWYYTNIFIKR